MIVVLTNKEYLHGIQYTCTFPEFDHTFFLCSDESKACLSKCKRFQIITL